MLHTSVGQQQQQVVNQRRQQQQQHAGNVHIIYYFLCIVYYLLRISYNILVCIYILLLHYYCCCHSRRMYVSIEEATTYKTAATIRKIDPEMENGKWKIINDERMFFFLWACHYKQTSSLKYQSRWRLGVQDMMIDNGMTTHTHAHTQGEHTTWSFCLLLCSSSSSTSTTYNLLHPSTTTTNTISPNLRPLVSISSAQQAARGPRWRTSGV